MYWYRRWESNPQE